MNKLKQIAASALIVPVVFAGSVSALNAGQIEQGDIYRVRNVTQNGQFTDPASANVCETVQFKVRIHNPGPDPLTGVTVKATLNTESSASHSSVATISADNANPASVSDTAGVNLTKAAGMSYVNDSTQLLDPNGTVITKLPNTILTTGVSIPNGVGVSTEQRRYVQFEAKVDCPKPPVTPPVTPPTPPATTKTTTTTLPNTGPGSVIAIAAGATILGTAFYRRHLMRSLSK
jgi:uncharacterized repeat protein (TIGR01451 family)